ncbi:unnamed protein product, partial [Prorocentrum cordatum]
GADLIHAFAAAGVDRARRLLFTRSGGGDGPLPAHLLPRNPMTYCTICSGTDIPSIAVAASVKAAGEVFCKLRQPGVPAPMFKQVFLCELHDDKRTFAMKVSASSGHADCCAFKGAKDLAKTHAMCSRHGVIIGTSCKDLSYMNVNKGSFSLKDKTSPGGSADTFRAFLAYLDAVNIYWFIWENVDLTTDADQ